MKGGEIGLRIRGGKKRWSLIYYLNAVALAKKIKWIPNQRPGLSVINGYCD